MASSHIISRFARSATSPFMVVVLSVAVSQNYRTSHGGLFPPFPRSAKPLKAKPSYDRVSGPPRPATAVPSSTYASESSTLQEVASSRLEKAKYSSGPPRPGYSVSSSLHTVTSDSPRPKTNGKPAPEILFFHNPASETSVSMLSLLQQAQKAFPNTRNRTLDFKLTVLERLPSVSELHDMYGLHREGSWTMFHASHVSSGCRNHPISARGLLEGIEHARMAEVAKAKQNAEQESPHETAVTQSPSSNSPSNEPSASELLAEKSVVLDIDHPLFGTQIFAWPVIVCWEMKEVLAGANAKQVHRLLEGLAASNRDKVQEKEEERKDWHSHWAYPETEISTDEDDTFIWSNESSQKPGKKLSF